MCFIHLPDIDITPHKRATLTLLSHASPSSSSPPYINSELTHSAFYFWAAVQTLSNQLVNLLRIQINSATENWRKTRKWPVPPTSRHVC